MRDDEGSVVILTKGDILQAAALVDAIVNPVNCVGTMGAGLALEVKRAYPDNFVAYKGACLMGTVRTGRMFITSNPFGEPKFVINFPTKRHWKDRSKIEDIRDGLADLAREIQERDIRSIAIPALGCGLGGLDWTAVKPMILAATRPIRNLRTIIYEPHE